MGSAFIVISEAMEDNDDIEDIVLKSREIVQVKCTYKLL